MKAYVLIEDGGFPVFNLSDDKVSGVEISVRPLQLARWTRAARNYAKAQTEMHAAVDEYAPAAVNEARAAKVAE